MSGIVQVKAVEVRFGGVLALGGVTLGVSAGERLALVGANGSGKSTLLRVLHGLVAPSRGSVLRDSATRQAMLFQRPHLLRLSAGQRRPGPVDTRHALDAGQGAGLARAGPRGLGSLAQRNARTLSGGQQQRVAMARAWALRPQVLLLDEPTASLDPHAKREVEALMEEFSSGPDAMTLIFASHNLGQVKRLASRVIYLEHGRVLADLPVADFFTGSLLQQQYPAAHLFVKGELV